jgi:hypothetical protein
MLTGTFLLYTDPGTGALIWQLLVAAGLGAAFYFRQYLGKVRTLLSGSKRRGRETD